MSLTEAMTSSMYLSRSPRSCRAEACSFCACESCFCSSSLLSLQPTSSAMQTTTNATRVDIATSLVMCDIGTIPEPDLVLFLRCTMQLALQYAHVRSLSIGHGA